ncbi:MAG: efflux transporter outer membrane subunit [Verrucomicrobia bacterium]|nr:efflux transporter outer membrane subunit [Verrucomicrobiota bacterium]
MYKLVLIPILGAVLTGCAVGPNYQPPTTATPATFGRAATNQFAPANPEAHWWAMFADPTLNELIARAAKKNHDVKIAEAHLNEARALRRGALWAFAPQGGVSGRFQRRQLALPEVAGANLPSRLGNTWSTGFDATWEIDLFGRLRRSAEAASAEVGVTGAQLRDVQVALLAEVAANYFGLQGARDTVGLLRQQRELLERSLNTTQLRVAAGRGSALDTARAQALLKETEAAVPLAEREEAQHLHRLAVLLGEQPGTFSLAFGPRETVQPARQIAIGTPAELLRRRPDVSAAERQLAAATARLGVRTAEMFPEVSVSGFIRLIGSEGVSLGSAASQAWGVAPTATWHVLSLGRLNAVRNASRFQVNAAVDHYEQTVLRALEDMENSLLRYRTADERLRLLGERQSAADRAHRIAQDQYQAGAISSLEATDAERTALAAARETTVAATEHRLAVVAVYKALGGGWNDEQLWARK